MPLGNLMPPPKSGGKCENGSIVPVRPRSSPAFVTVQLPDAALTAWDC